MKRAVRIPTANVETTTVRAADHVEATVVLVETAGLTVVPGEKDASSVTDNAQAVNGAAVMATSNLAEEELGVQDETPTPVRVAMVIQSARVASGRSVGDVSESTKGQTCVRSAKRSKRRTFRKTANRKNWIWSRGSS